MTFDEVRRTPPIVVGSGVAGLTVALGLPEAVVMTKTGLSTGGSSHWAQGGIAAAVGSDDSVARHAADTIAVSGGIADSEAVATLTAGGPAALRRLIESGASFDRAADGSLHLGREAGHSARRIVHAHGDATGAEVMRALTAAAKASPHIELVPGTVAVDLALANGRVVGLLAIDGDGRRILFLAPAVVLATGGAGRVYARTTNPPAVTGDGLAMAARAGAVVADLEFVQFHPTALDAGVDPMPLLTEALRGEGAVLIDDDGRRIMEGLHQDMDLAPRDVVARAVWTALHDGRQVYLDASAVAGAAFPTRFPTVFAAARAAGIDPRAEAMPVSPASHYYMGGIAAAPDGATSLPGLRAVGEASSTGVHGANRLASNSLLEGLVFGARTAVALSADLVDPPSWGEVELAAGAAGARVEPAPQITAAIRSIMWESASIVRTGDGLLSARRGLSELAVAAGPDVETRNLLTTASLIVEAALDRCESRGAHFRADYPYQDPDLSARSFRSQVELVA